MVVEIKEDDTVRPTMFSWCKEGRHEHCRRSFRKFIVDVKTNKLIWENIVYQCSCKTRGCKCYTKPADRPKPAKKTRRKK